VSWQVCRKEPQCRLEVDHWGLCAPAKTVKYPILDEAPKFGDIITKGRIWSPPPSNFGGRRPYSTLVIGTSPYAAERLVTKLKLLEDECIIAYPGCPSFAGLIFERIYVDGDLIPELRTPEEEEWFERMHPHFRASFAYV
jgi:hypothetical protein